MIEEIWRRFFWMGRHWWNAARDCLAQTFKVVFSVVLRIVKVMQINWAESNRHNSQPFERRQRSGRRVQQASIPRGWDGVCCCSYASTPRCSCEPADGDWGTCSAICCTHHRLHWYHRLTDGSRQRPVWVAGHPRQLFRNATIWRHVRVNVFELISSKFNTPTSHRQLQGICQRSTCASRSVFERASSCPEDQDWVQSRADEGNSPTAKHSAKVWRPHRIALRQKRWAITRSCTCDPRRKINRCHQ